MLNRRRRFGSTGSEGEKATNSPRLTQPAQSFRKGAETFAAVRNRRPASDLALGIIVSRRSFFKRPPGHHWRSKSFGARLKIFIRRAGESGRKCV
jgi:hypothetical protein